MREPIQLFYSYSHKDEELRDALETHLSILKRQGATIDWHDRKILPGQNWESEIDARINTADIVLLLVSPDFIASDYCYGLELSRALERHEAGKTQVVPIILRPVDWTGAPFAKFQVLPKDGKPVTTWLNHDEAWLDVSKGMRRLLDNAHARKAPMAASSGPVQLRELLSPALSSLEDLYNSRMALGGATTGFRDLDLFTNGIHKSDIVLICSRPSVGKSDLALNIASQLARETSLPVLFFSIRLSREQVTHRLIAAESRISMRNIRNGWLMMEDWSRLTIGVGALVDLPIFIDASTGYTEVELARRIGKMKDTNQLGLVVVDGVEHLTSAQNYSTRQGEVRAVVKVLRQIAVDQGVPIVLTATTAREIDPRICKFPRITDLEDWEPLASDAANIVLMLYRPEGYWIDGPDKGITAINVAKNAYGYTGTVRLGYRSEWCRFVNLAEEDRTGEKDENYEGTLR